ncbi:Hypothetical predicted protein [Lecanosticta acicola]|uniref:Uncharacterized protein n=1 Tax=Lecanosticta acicola TaxID=111012 RepID=A0AAI9E831_9PEZI|nr:Hypothetical predicted protein [Lecanosticta acicola]
MVPAEVSSSVLSIVASFTGGLDKNASADDEETRLARSLRQGPEDIGREYQRSVQAAGQDFAYGDAIAQTSLAEILLKLNTGLVSIINSFLAKDEKDASLHYQSLVSLSERSRIDTCRTLRELLRRMLQLRLPKHIGERQQALSHRPSNDASQLGKKLRTPVASPRRSPKVRGPTLARVVIADSSRPSQVAMVRPGQRKKKSQSSFVGSSNADSNVSLALPKSLISQSVDRLPQLRARPSRPDCHRAQTLPAQEHKPRRKQSAMDFRASQHPSQRQDALRTNQSASGLNKRPNVDHGSLPPMPNTAPLPTMEPHRRKPTPTYYSIESNSTKLGEIPLHKWAEPYDFDAMSRMNLEAEQNGWPLNDLDKPRGRRKRGLGIFRLFRRNRDE